METNQTPDEWQREPGPFGKRFRMVGNIKEYEPEINGIPESIFHDMKKREKEQKEAEYKAAAQKAQPQRNCPFSDGMNTACSLEKCALFLHDNCALAQTFGSPAKDTKGLLCPLNKYRQQCRTDCALYKGGCALTSVL